MPDKDKCLHSYKGDNEKTAQCKCHEKLGNDFWFLPADECLYEKKEKPDAHQP